LPELLEKMVMRAELILNQDKIWWDIKREAERDIMILEIKYMIRISE
jgi:hypothetical protein